MGAMKQKRLEDKERKYKPRNGAGGPADWHNVDVTVLIRAIAIVTKAGGALRFGYTRDGGAYAIGVYGDGDPYTIYVRPSESVEGVLGDLTDAFTDM